MMITPGNKKTGPFCYCFSLPPVITCPGVTDECRAVCYARRLCELRPWVRAKWFANYDMVRQSPEESYRRILSEIKLVNPPYFRIHVSGDFFTVAYFQMWQRIASETPEVKYLAFTKMPYTNSVENLTLLQSHNSIPKTLEDARWLYPTSFICPATRKKHDPQYKASCNVCGYHCWFAEESPVFLLH